MKWSYKRINARYIRAADIVKSVASFTDQWHESLIYYFYGENQKPGLVHNDYVYFHLFNDESVTKWHASIT